MTTISMTAPCGCRWTGDRLTVSDDGRNITLVNVVEFTACWGHVERVKERTDEIPGVKRRRSGD